MNDAEDMTGTCISVSGALFQCHLSLFDGTLLVHWRDSSFIFAYLFTLLNLVLLFNILTGSLKFLNPIIHSVYASNKTP